MAAARKPALRWSSAEDAPRRHILKRGGERLATVQISTHGGGWFAYGVAKNGSPFNTVVERRPLFRTPQDAKDHAMHRVKGTTPTKEIRDEPSMG